MIPSLGQGDPCKISKLKDLTTSFLFIHVFIDNKLLIFSCHTVTHQNKDFII